MVASHIVKVRRSIMAMSTAAAAAAGPRGRGVTTRGRRVATAVVVASLGLAGVGVVMSLFSSQTPLTKIVVLVLALLLLLPLLWAPVSAAVAIAFFAHRSIEYSGAYAAFRIGVSDVLWPISQGFGFSGVLEALWSGFQWIASLVGFLSAWVNAWPVIKRLLGQEPTPA